MCRIESRLACDLLMDFRARELTDVIEVSPVSGSLQACVEGFRSGQEFLFIQAGGEDGGLR